MELHIGHSTGSGGEGAKEGRKEWKGKKASTTPSSNSRAVAWLEHRGHYPPHLPSPLPHDLSPTLPSRGRRSVGEGGWSGRWAPAGEERRRKMGWLVSQQEVVWQAGHGGAGKGSNFPPKAVVVPPVGRDGTGKPGRGGVGQRSWLCLPQESLKLRVSRRPIAGGAAATAPEATVPRLLPSPARGSLPISFALP